MNSDLSDSFEKVPYDLRPCKQVERRILLEGFQFLQQSGFDIPTYHYAGFGSIDFVDFIMFHKYLGITKFTSAEANKNAQKRAVYNKPYKNVNVYFGLGGDLIQELDPDEKVVLWLDYDFHLNSTVSSELSSALARLRSSSIVLVTVDLEPPVKAGNPQEWFEHYYDELGEHLDPAWTADHFGRSELKNRAIEVLRNIVSTTMQGRPQLELSLFYNFQYADGHTMLTFAGMITDESERTQLRNSKISSTPFYRSSWSEEPYAIHVPKLTRKERIYLGQFMPAGENWRPSQFYISKADLDAYKEIYRYLPTYAELYL